MIMIMSKPGTGKSTLMKALFEEVGSRLVCGFYTEEIKSNGIRQGFQMVDMLGNITVIAHVDMESNIRIGRYGVNVLAIEETMLPILDAALQKDEDRVVLLDEIGFMQIESTRIRLKFQELLDSNKRFIATTTNESHPWIDLCKTHPQVRLIELTEDNRDSLKSDLIQLCRLG